MKRTESLYRTAVLLLLLMLAAACTRDDTFDDAAPGNATDPAAPLTITVTDGAYAPETSAANAATDHGAPATRAVENGFATGFTKGDKIGLYVADAKVYGPGNLNDLRITASNLCLTYDGTRWMLPADTELEYDPAKGRDILYFAYYPYQANMSGNEPDGNNPDGLPTDTAPDFFHELIGKWKPQDDQSTYADYAASDLMVARGEVATRTDGTPGSTLSFNMEHQMQLNIVRLPYIKSTYTEAIGEDQQTKSYYLYTGVAHVPYFWMENPHTARLITNPSGDVKKITGCYYYDSRPAKREFEIEIPNKKELRGKYKTYTIDGATETKSNRGAPQEGDFYMKDGTVLPQEHYKNSNMPQNVKDDCIGIVFWVGEKGKYHWTKTQSREGDCLLMYDHPGCTHGMVVALQDATNGAKWGPDIEDDKSLGLWAENFGEFTNDEQSKWNNIILSGTLYGYSRSAIIDLYTTHNAGSRFPAYQAVKEYANANSTPEESSGWFFPGMNELATIVFGTPNDIGDQTIEHWNKINSQIEKTNGNKMTGRYWSNSDFEGNMAWQAYPDDKYELYNAKPKSDSYKVRAVLAF